MKLCFDMQQIVNEIKTEFQNYRAETRSCFEKLETVPAKVMPSIAQFFGVLRTRIRCKRWVPTDNLAENVQQYC
jgi:hypothetical protein